VSLLYTRDENGVTSQLQEIFENHTPKSKKSQFLNVLTYLNEQKNDPELLNTSRNIAYEIISEQLEEGKLTHIYTLKQFLPEDPLISSDCSRFTAKGNTPKEESSPASPVLQLDKNIKWIHAIGHRNQFLALGIKDSKLQLARGNWYGNVEYYTWSDPIKITDYLALIADPLRSNRILLHAPSSMALEEKKLARNKYFDEELILTNPRALSKGYIGISFNSQGGISALAASNDKLSMHQYTMESYLQYTVDCRFDNKLPGTFTSSGALSEMIYRNGFYYTFKDNFFLKISDEGAASALDVNARIGLFAASTQYAKFRIALGTDNGCLLLRQIGGELKGESDFFARDIVPVDMKFISASILVIAAKYSLAVYQINDDVLKSLHSIKVHSPIVSVLSTTNRKQFAYMQENGQIFTASIEEE
jgi:hypothetical protein